jgi:alkylation response protein AidB-like acyl-CoA dehydrogenase
LTAAAHEGAHCLWIRVGRDALEAQFDTLQIGGAIELVRDSPLARRDRSARIVRREQCTRTEKRNEDRSVP